jgi:NAD(P)-dependent dehydrogenase (short-subunit alcohol dehydrogenase family)
MSRTILITGAGSGFGEGAALGLARKGHKVIAGVQNGPQVTQLRARGQMEGLDGLRVEKLDLLDPYDLAQAHRWEIDVLLNNAGIGEGGPVAEIPLQLVRSNFETNVFAPLALTQGFIRQWVEARRPGKIVFTSSVAGIVAREGTGTYAATKHAIEAIATVLAKELRPFGIKVQTINPGPHLTGFNERMAEAAFRWLEDDVNFTPREELRAMFDRRLGSEAMHADPVEVIDQMVRIVPSMEGRFRNVVPADAAKALKAQQAQDWDALI